MKKIAIALLSFILTSGSGAARAQTTPPATICRAQLRGAIDAIASRPQFARSRWGISVQTVASATTLYSLDAERYFIPASTLKLLTTAAALRRLGPDYRIRTSVYGDGNGSIYIVGRGDPSLTVTQLRDLAKQLKARGITQINRLIADDSYFRGSAVNPTWEWEDVQAGHGAPVNSLILNRNAMDLMFWPQNVGEPLRVTWVNPEERNGWQVENNSTTVAPNGREFVEIGRDFFRPLVRVGGQLRAGSEPEPMYVAIVRPAENFLRRFGEVLEAEGIRVLQSSLSVSPASSQLTELAAVDSPPLSELIKELNLESDNVYAEALLKTLGARRQGSDALDAGLKEIEIALRELGVDPEGYDLRDGSGLSRHNLVSPKALVETLRGMANSPFVTVYQSSLPSAAVSGTLRRRFANSSAREIVLAKTGTLTGVSGLAGYVFAPNYNEVLVFAILVNQSNFSSRVLRQAIDEIVVLLAGLDDC